MKWTSVKLLLALVGAVSVGLYIHTVIGYIINTRYTKPSSRNTVSVLPPEVATLAYKVYGDMRSDDIKIIQWVNQPGFIRKHPHLVPAKCENTYRCAVAHDVRYIGSSHALILSTEGVEKHGIPYDKMRNHVRIIFDYRPPLRENIRKLKTVLKHNPFAFNWTISYRADSDIPISYGQIVEKKVVPLYNLTRVVSRKTKTAVLFQRSCKTPSKVEDYLERLRRYIPVDVFGDCQSSFLCDDAFDVACYTSVGRDYKFYLALEDVLCPEYVTDRFFRFFGTDAVPVVRGGADYSKVAPEGTFINTADFKSVEALGKYLKHLDEHDHEYVKYLKEKRNYESIYSQFEIYQGKEFLGLRYFNMDKMICELCQRLWNIERYAKIYEDVVHWYEKAEDACVRPTDLK